MGRNINFQNWYFLLLFLVVISIATISAIIFFNDHPKYDDPDFFTKAKNLLERGTTNFYYGEDFSHSKFYGEGNEIYGNVNFPMYELLMAPFMVVVGMGFPQAKLFNLFIYCINLLLICLIAKKCGKQILFFSLIFALSIPILSRYYYVLGPDTTVLTLFILLFFYLFIVLEQAKPSTRIIVLSFAFSLAFFSKFTLPPMIIISLFIYYLLKKKFRTAFYEPLLIGGLGTLLGLLYWFIFSYLTNVPFSYPFIVTLYNRFVLTLGSNYFSHSTRLVYDFFWVTPPFFILVILAFIERIKLYFQTKTVEYIDFIWIFVVLTFVGHTLKAPGLYYKFPLFLLSCLLVGHYLSIRSKKSYSLLSLFIFISSVSYLLLVWIDPILILPKLLPWTEFSPGFILQLFIFLLPLLLGLLIFRVPSLSIQHLLFLMTLGYSLFFFVLFISVDYDTLHYYGETGFDETYTFLQKNVKKDDIIISYKDLPHLLDRKFYWIEIFTEKDNNGIIQTNDDKAISILLNPSVKYLVYSSNLEEVHGGIRKSLLPTLNTHFLIVARYGDYVIYEKSLGLSSGY